MMAPKTKNINRALALFGIGLIIAGGVVLTNVAHNNLMTHDAFVH